jgi:GDP-mannose 6-dehydrogenase
MNVSVFGLGYVGSVTAACLASQGHHVIGVDVNAEKVKSFKNGLSPIIEPGLDTLIRDAVDSASISATQDAAAAVTQSEVSMICVGTPSDPNGNLNFEYLDRVFTEIGRALAGVTDYKVIALRSTILPGTLTNRLLPLLGRESGKQVGMDFGMVVNPEFLREGSAASDFNNPPFTLIGQMDNRAGDVMEELYANIPAPLFRTSPDTACMVKYASNAFHALKVAFANEIGMLSKELGVDGTKVMEVFCQDTRLNISPRYLKPGFAFGGSCLPKDLRALLYLARHSDLQVPVLEAIIPSNQLQIQRVIDLILRDQRRNVGIIGLSFKTGTDDLRESPLVDLAEALIGKGLQVRIYDNTVALSNLMGSNKEYIERVIPHIAGLMSTSREEVIQNSDIVVVAHNIENGPEKITGLFKQDQLIIDFVKIYTDEEETLSAYEGVCW